MCAEVRDSPHRNLGRGLTDITSRDYLDIVSQIIIRSSSLEEMLDQVLERFLDFFACDRAWLLHPFDIHKTAIHISMEKNRPEWPGAGALGIDISRMNLPNDVYALAIKSPETVCFDATRNTALLQDQCSHDFSIRSMMAVALHTARGKPYLLGIHHCNTPKVYSQSEADLLKALGTRLADGINSLSRYASAQYLFKTSEVSIWHEDFSAVIAELNQLWQSGVIDLRTYLTENKQKVFELASMVDIVDVNDATLKLFGYDSKEQLLSSIETTFGPDAIKVFADELCAIWNKEEIFRAETVFKKKDGETFNALITFQIPRFPEAFRNIPVSIIDITELKTTEAVLIKRTELLEASEKRYRELYENSPLGYQSLSPDGEFVETNPSLCRMLGYNRDEIIGQWFGNYLAPDSQKTFRTNFPKFKARGETHKVPFQMLTKDKGPISVEIDGRIGYDENGNMKQTHCVVHDVTERKKAQEQVRTLSQAIEQSPVTVVITDLDGKIEYVNSAFENITGYSSDEVIGQNTNILMSGNLPEERYAELWSTIQSGKAWRGEFQNRKKNGELFWEYVHIAPVLDETGKAMHFLEVKEDITLRKQHEEQITYQAHFDALTGLPNRFLAIDRLTALLNNAQREETFVAVLFLDLDNFKKINDTLGHDIGDKLLTEAADRIRRIGRSGDTHARLGGDEFIVILGALKDTADIAPILKAILDQFRKTFIVDNREILMTISIGAAIYPTDGETPSDLLRNADLAMYHSKREGRDTYSFFTESMNKEVSRKFSIEEQMHSALQRGEFYLQYQPLVDIASCRMIGVEALLRWENARLGSLPPTEFIPIAEHSGMIRQIGDYVLRHAIKTVAGWKQTYNREIGLAINLSPHQLRNTALPSLIKNLLDANNLSSQILTVEITEGVLMSGYSYVETVLNRFKEIGIHIALDDFGTGYSSLSYLRTYPFTTLKIDRSFIRDINDDRSDLELVNAAIAMAHNLGLNVVAEGVETKEQYDLLAMQGCDLSQGYLFSKPVDPEQIEQMLKSGNDRFDLFAGHWGK